MSETFEQIKEHLPIIAPLAIIQLSLMVAALVHALKHPNYKVGNKALWIIVILFVSLFGAILYFVIGKGDSGGDEYE